jgi:hypothetical protein
VAILLFCIAESIAIALIVPDAVTWMAAPYRFDDADGVEPSVV